MRIHIRIQLTKIALAAGFSLVMAGCAGNKAQQASGQLSPEEQEIQKLHSIILDLMRMRAELTEPEETEPEETEPEETEPEETERDKLKVLCKEKFAEDYICGIGEWTSNSKDTALQIATWLAKGEISNNEKITGIRIYSKRSQNGNKVEDSEICTINTIDNISGIRAEFIQSYGEGYILLNGKISGICTYSYTAYKSKVEEYYNYVVNVGEGVPDIKIQEIRTKYDQESNIYTVYVLATLPKNFLFK